MFPPWRHPHLPAARLTTTGALTEALRSDRSTPASGIRSKQSAWDHGGGEVDGTAHLAAARPRGGAPPSWPSIGLTSGGRGPCNPLDRAGEEGRPCWPGDPSGGGWGGKGDFCRILGVGKVKRRTFPRSLRRGLAQSLAARMVLERPGSARGGGTGAGAAAKG